MKNLFLIMLLIGLGADREAERATSRPVRVADRIATMAVEGFTLGVRGPLIASEGETHRIAISFENKGTLAGSYHTSFAQELHGEPSGKSVGVLVVDPSGKKNQFSFNMRGPSTRSAGHTSFFGPGDRLEREIDLRRFITIKAPGVYKITVSIDYTIGIDASDDKILEIVDFPIVLSGAKADAEKGRDAEKGNVPSD